MTIRIGVLGCGVIAYWAHLRSLRYVRGATLAGAADPDPRARERATRLAGVPVYAAADELLARSDIDALIICAPTHLHAELAVAAAGRGKHFYLEKPIAASAGDASRVVEAARAGGVHGVMGFNRRRHPLYEQVRNVLAAGRIGRVRAVQTALCEPMPLAGMPEWKRRRETGGGVLLDLASHHFDALRWLLDDDLAVVGGSVRSDLSEQDTARLELVTSGGIEIQSFFSFRAGRADVLELIGEHGTVRLDYHAPRLSLRLGRRFGYGVRDGWLAPSASLAAWRLHRLVRPSANPSYRRSLQAFVDVCRGRHAATASLEDGARSLEAALSAELTLPCVPC
jgi:predicted dehydrogenase